MGAVGVSWEDDDRILKEIATVLLLSLSRRDTSRRAGARGACVHVVRDCSLCIVFVCSSGCVQLLYWYTSRRFVNTRKASDFPSFGGVCLRTHVLDRCSRVCEFSPVDLGARVVCV